MLLLWHGAADIVTIDPEGFIAIKSRAIRFAKIVGAKQPETGPLGPASAWMRKSGKS